MLQEKTLKNIYKYINKEVYKLDATHKQASYKAKDKFCMLLSHTNTHTDTHVH